MPEVSIVTPYYAGEPYIGRTIESVLGQTFTDWEHVVVDDGSPGDLPSVIGRYLDADPRIRLVRQPNGGPCRARNTGFAACSAGSDYLLFLDQDDCLEPEMLAVLVEHMHRHPDVGMAFCDRVFIDGDDRPYEPYRGQVITRYVPHGRGVRELPPGCPDTPFESLFAYSIAVPSITLLRRSVYEAAGAWDETLGLYDDTDMFLRIALRSQAHYLPLRLVRRRIHGHQITRSETAASRSSRAEGARGFTRKWRSPRGLSPEQRRLVAEARRFKEGCLMPHLWFGWARERLRRGDHGEAARCWLRGLRQLALHAGLAHMGAIRR